MLASLSHPHVIKYIEHFEDDTSLYIVTEYLPGGELFERIVQRQYYSEQDVRAVMKTLLETIKYCHDRGVVHRDIKPENILLQNPEDDASVKLADFGFAKKVDESSFSMLQTACGTPGYVAPEILGSKEAPYDKRVDVWSLGIVAYILLCGYPPFREKTQKALFARIRKAQYEFDSPWWDPVSDAAKDFVRKMIVVNPDERATLEDLLQHEFLQSSLSIGDLTDNLNQLRDWNAKRKIDLLKNTWSAVTAFKSFGKQRSSRRDFASDANAADDRTTSAVDEGQEKLPAPPPSPGQQQPVELGGNLDPIFEQNAHNELSLA